MTGEDRALLDYLKHQPSGFAQLETFQQCADILGLMLDSRVSMHIILGCIRHSAFAEQLLKHLFQRLNEPCARKDTLQLLLEQDNRAWLDTGVSRMAMQEFADMLLEERVNAFLRVGHIQRAFSQLAKWANDEEGKLDATQACCARLIKVVYESLRRSERVEQKTSRHHISVSPFFDKRARRTAKAHEHKLAGIRFAMSLGFEACTEHARCYHLTDEGAMSLDIAEHFRLRKQAARRARHERAQKAKEEK